MRRQQHISNNHYFSRKGDKIRIRRKKVSKSFLSCIKIISLTSRLFPTKLFFNEILFYNNLSDIASKIIFVR